MAALVALKVGHMPQLRSRTDRLRVLADATLPDGQPDQVEQALRKIAGSIGKPSKFVKAAALVRQLLAGGQLSRERHRQPLFEVGSLAQVHVHAMHAAPDTLLMRVQVLRASMVNPETSSMPELAREYSKLFTAASKHREVFPASICSAARLTSMQT